MLPSARKDKAGRVALSALELDSTHGRIIHY